MTSVLFKEIYSRFFLKTEAYDLFQPSVSDKMRNELLCGYVHSAVTDPLIRDLFSTIHLTDPVIERDDSGKYSVDGLLEYEMEIEIDAVTDKEFILEIISDGMVLAWVNPKINSVLNIEQYIGNSDTKIYAQSPHIQAIRGLREDTYLHRNKLVSDRNALHNDYLNGDITTRRTTS